MHTFAGSLVQAVAQDVALATGARLGKQRSCVDCVEMSEGAAGGFEGGTALRSVELGPGGETKQGKAVVDAGAPGGEDVRLGEGVMEFGVELQQAQVDLGQSEPGVRPGGAGAGGGAVRVARIVAAGGSVCVAKGGVVMLPGMDVAKAFEVAAVRDRV